MNKSKKNEARIIDIDLIFYGNEEYTSRLLRIPHENWKNRIFVLQPLIDIYENYRKNSNYNQVYYYFQKSLKRNKELIEKILCFHNENNKENREFCVQINKEISLYVINCNNFDFLMKEKFFFLKFQILKLKKTLSL